MATAAPADPGRPNWALRRYSTVAMWFHWTIAALVILNLSVGLLREGVAALRPLMGLHKAVGITVLLLTLGRVAWRLGHRPPPLPASVPGWQKGLSHGVHWALYALLILMPLTGWIMVSGPEGRRPLTWFALFDLPYLPVSGAAADSAHGGHELLAWVMLALAAIHVGAAILHLVRRDGVVWRMAPALERPRHD